MHFHGIIEKSWYDGTFETQRPIRPGYFFDYEVTPPMGSAGSYLYHDHAMSFAAATATGPAIVDPAKKGPYDYAEDRIIFLSDVFRKSDKTIETGLTAEKFVFSGNARNILVNGKGYGVSSISVKEEEMNPESKKDTCEIEVLRVTAGKTYRLRFISGTAMTFLTFAVKPESAECSEQPLQVIEADGGYTEPYHTDRISIASGQRYSVLLPASTLEAYRAEGGFWLEGREVNRNSGRGPISIWIKVEDPKTASNHQAISMNGGFDRDEYSNQKMLNWKTKEYESFSGIKFAPTVLEDMPLKPLFGYDDFPTTAEVTATVILRGKDFRKTAGEGFLGPEYKVHWGLGEDPYFGPLDGTPRLLPMATNQEQSCPNPAAYDPLTHPNHYDKANKIYAFDKGAVLDIVLLNMPPSQAEEYSYVKPQQASDSHPFHMHGAHYYDLGAGEGDYDDDAKSQIEDNIKNGRVLKRDTSVLYNYKKGKSFDSADGWRVLRIKVQSLGVWLLHCHTHAYGHGVAFAFGKPEDIQGLPKPKLNGWDSEVARNVFFEKAEEDACEQSPWIGGSFSEIDTTGQTLGETLDQGPFGVKADSLRESCS